MADKNIKLNSLTEGESTSLISKQEKDNYELFKTKLIYLCYYGASGSLIIYLPVYYRQLNMTDLQAGILASLVPFGRFIGGPLWGAISDRTGRHKRVLLTAYMMYSLLIMMIYPFSLIDNTSIQLNTTVKWNETLNGDCVTPIDCVTTSTNHSSSFSIPFLGNQAIFWLLFFLTGAAFLFVSIVDPIMDATVVTMGTDVDYGNLRLWGAIGYGCFGFLSGLAANEEGKLLAEVNDKANFLLPFIMFLVLNIVAFIVCLTLKSVEGREPSIMVVPHIKLLVTKPHFLVFSTIVLIMGISSGVTTWFTFIFLKDLGGSQTLLGISLAVSCSSEVVVFPLSGRFIRRLGSDNILFISLAIFIVRLVACSFLQDPWLVLSIEPLHGFTFAAMWAACVSYAISISPPEIATTVIALITSIYFGLGWGLGGAFGGIMYQYYGPRVLFRSCAVLCGIGMLLHTFAVMALRQLSDENQD